jgi:hypothetical protein
MTPQATLDLIRRNRQPQARVAVVTAVVVSPLAITCQFEDGEAFQPLVLGTSPAPAVTDRVLLVPTDVGWVYIDTLVSPAAPPPDQEIYLELVNNWERVHRADGTWYQMNHGSEQFFQQGHLPSQAGEDGMSPGVFYDSGAILDHGAPAAFAALAAQSATVQLVDLQIRRNAGGPDLVSPVLYGHNYNTANPPPVNDPPWAPGFGPLRLAPIGRFETGRYALPATWVTALAASTVRGIGFWAETTSDALFSDSEWGGQVVAPMNLQLRIVYSVPT